MDSFRICGVKRCIDKVACHFLPLFGLLAIGNSAAESIAKIDPKIPRDAIPVMSKGHPQNYRLHVEFSSPQGGSVLLSKDLSIPLTGAAAYDLAVEIPNDSTPLLRVWTDGKLTRGPEKIASFSEQLSLRFPDAAVDFGGDFTALACFTSLGDGTLFSKCSPDGKWSVDGKSLYIRDGRLVYDIAWLGEFSTDVIVSDGKQHRCVLAVQGGVAKLWLDGKLLGEKKNFSKADVKGHVVKIAHTEPDFAGDLKRGEVSQLRIWKRALPEQEMATLLAARDQEINTPEFLYEIAEKSAFPVIKPANGVTVKSSWFQSLERSDHAQLVAGWNQKTLAEGKKIYAELCLTCHGTKEKEGSLPTALRFGKAPFKNGGDPFSMYHTITHGYGQMTPMPQYTTAQKYAVIQYIREEFLRESTASPLTEITPEYLAMLPKALARAEKEKEIRDLPPYLKMDLGPALMWTLQIEPGNIAQKAIAVRLDPGPGGVGKGRAWMIYDHDTMRVAAGTTGDFVDWKGIAFDGSHGTHTSIKGEKHFINPVGPGWASPEGNWDDARLEGKDHLHYGPLAKKWVEYLGMYVHGNQIVISSKVAGTQVWETPSFIEKENTTVFVRSLEIAASAQPLLLRVAPDSVQVALRGDGEMRKENGFWVASIKGPAKTQLFISRCDAKELESLKNAAAPAIAIEALTHGGAAQWQQETTTTSEAGKDDTALTADTFPLPTENPWHSWMRASGFDFTPDHKAAIVAMWNGDIWRVDGIMERAPAPLRWKRIAAGLFQPLGVKFRGDELFVTCRDQLACLRDLNADGEIDFIQCYNNDHQVTEHFHEFAMGLQIDKSGNFYYAKSGRHALDSVVPQHGTLLKISADGSKTEIIATGFRAANGVCINDDGSFFVTDQEGFWTPKNRINRVKPGGFYGNMFGYSPVTDTADSAMEQPLVWVTNAKDRSPAELVWIPKNTWGSLGGSLLNLSYGTGKAYIIPHENIGDVWQGAVCELSMPAFPTGIMRGRFGSDGALYTCGMFAWAGNANSPGGFYRIRYNDKPTYLPVAIHATHDQISITFSDKLDPKSITTESFTFKVWDIKRSAGYGSKHFDEHAVTITKAKLGEDLRTVDLLIPGLSATRCYEVTVNISSADGSKITRSIHGTIHQIKEN